MDILLNFQPFVFSSSGQSGFYVEGLPLTSPIGNTLASHGRIFGLFSIKYPEVFPIDLIGKEVFPFFEESYYNHECLSVHEHLLDCLRETQLYIEKKILEYGSVENIDFSLCVGVVWGSVLYCARFGGMTGVRLYRDSSFGDLFEIDNASGSSPIVSLSGYVQPGDVVCVYNNSVNSSHFPVSLENLKKLNSPVIYPKLSQYFNDPIKETPACCVAGFYIDSEKTPSVEEERIVFVDIESGNRLQDIDDIDPTGFTQTQLKLDNELTSPSTQRLLPTEAAIKGFSSKIMPSGARSKVASGMKKFTSFFTRQRVFILGTMILLLFAGLIIIGHDYENTFKEKKQSAALKSELLPKAQEEYKQGLYYAELNPERAKNYLKSAKETISSFDAITMQDSEVKKLIHDIEVAYGAVTKTYVLNDLTPYFDLSTINSQIAGSTFSLFSSSLLVCDTAHNSVYKVGTDTRSGAAVIGPSDLEGLVGADGDGKSIYAVSSKKGIVRADEQSSAVTHLLETPGSWGTLSDMLFFGGNIYLLDQSHSQIWKYIPEGNGFGPVRNYISADSMVDLSDGVSFAVDGNVWIGKKSGDIVKLFSGKQDQFIVSGVEGNLKNIRSVYTDMDINYLYVLDELGSRIVVLDKKDGAYVSSYSSSNFKNASDILVDVKNRMLYVLAQQKIYKIELKENIKVEQ